MAAYSAATTNGRRGFRGPALLIVRAPEPQRAIDHAANDVLVIVGVCGHVVDVHHCVSLSFVSLYLLYHSVFCLSILSCVKIEGLALNLFHLPPIELGRDQKFAQDAMGLVGLASVGDAIDYVLHVVLPLFRLFVPLLYSILIMLSMGFA